MKAYDSVNLGRHTAKIVDVEISNNVRFGKYIADVFKPVYKVGTNTVKDNGIFKYKQVQGFSHDPKKNWGYAKFLNVMGVKNSSSTDDVSKFKNITQEEIQNKLSINIKNRKMTNDLKEWFNNKVDEIVATVKGTAKVSKDVVEDVEVTVNLAENDEIKNKISDFVSSLKKK